MSDEVEGRALPRPQRRPWLIAAALVVAILSGVYLWLGRVGSYDKISDWGSRGDAMAPLAAVLAAGAVLVGLYGALQQQHMLGLQLEALTLQRKELALQRKELKLQRREMADQRAEMHAQAKHLAESATAQNMLADAMSSAAKELHDLRRNVRHSANVAEAANNLTAIQLIGQLWEQAALLEKEHPRTGRNRDEPDSLHAKAQKLKERATRLEEELES